MVYEHKIVKIGGKRYISINCMNSADNSSLGNITCFRQVAKKVMQHPEADNIIFNRSYRKILNEVSFKVLREYLNSVAAMPDAPELCEPCFEKNSILRFKLQEDAIGSMVYLMDLQPCELHKKYFHSLRNVFSKTMLWDLVEQNRAKHSEAELYHVIFRDRILPGFVTFFVEPIENRTKALDKYEIAGAAVEIYEAKGRPNPIYHVTPTELNMSRKDLLLLNKAFFRLSKEDFELGRGDVLCQKVIDDLAPELDAEKKKKLARTLKRYSFGYGIVEVLLKDPKIQDVYIDSPGDKHVYVYHADFEECATNIILSAEELEKLATRFRMLSGRPFDESYPVLHAELKDLNVRIAGVTEPITFSGTGFVFRKHNVQPWTLQSFIANKMMSPEAAGMISFLMDNQKSMLITGPRGSGKTSLLGAVLAEVPQNFRIITIEDTPELPVEELREKGYNIQHLRVKSSLQRESYEVTAEEALRSALRLGESVLVLGEVRGEEAKSLFEAMRIGATGNVVMGTIHGSSPYDVWDRIVNDLKVPSTSFKATDVVISCAPLRMGEETRRHRRVTAITEVRKFWTSDPQKEGGFHSLFVYNKARDRLETAKDLRRSQLLQDIAKKKGMSMTDVLKSIQTRAKIKKLIVDAGKKNPALLGLEFASKSVNKYLELVRNQGGRRKLNYNKLLSEFKKWLKSEQKR
jgi:type IV secretory pathway ATPase VirB11/archaellum biosynthesis ATPase